MPRGVAINVGANTNEPGFRGPIYEDGSFEFVPIPEDEPTASPVLTYGELPVSIDIPEGLLAIPVHLDPEFAGYGPSTEFTYGDPFSVKARPLLELSAGDHVFFYATLQYHGTGSPESWIAPDWGAYIIGRFELGRDPIHGDDYPTLQEAEKSVFQSNAHVKRSSFDAMVLLHGDRDASSLYETAIPLSQPAAGTRPNQIVTEFSSDSGKGPWWRRPLKFDETGVSTIRGLEGKPTRFEDWFVESEEA